MKNILLTSLLTVSSQATFWETLVQEGLKDNYNNIGKTCKYVVDHPKEYFLSVDSRLAMIENNCGYGVVVSNDVNNKRSKEISYNSSFIKFFINIKDSELEYHVKEQIKTYISEKVVDLDSSSFYGLKLDYIDYEVFSHMELESVFIEKYSEFNLIIAQPKNTSYEVIVTTLVND